MSDTEPQITDWPPCYVSGLWENELFGLDDAEVLEALIRDHSAMRFGSEIDLNLQQGYYLHVGDGQITRVQGSDTGHVIGALGDLVIDITPDGNARWCAAEAEREYKICRCEKLTWVLANAVGPWFLTADLEEGKYDHWYWLVIRFLNVEDERAFIAEFRETGV